MSEKTPQALKFNCYKCGKQSTYPNYLTEGKDSEGVSSVIKRCTTCGAENKVELPEGWITDRPDSVLRGLEKE